jgi:MoaA/NifB/PqqE/SkfB family radical SAM enzyme
MSDLVLDGTKIGWHYDRVEAWEAGERFAPVTVDTALTRACDAKCWFCYAQLQESQTRSNISEKNALDFLDDCAEIGVRGVSYVSDGESDLHPTYATAIEHGRSLGISMASGTNGWRVTPEIAERILPCLTYIRFNVSGGTPERYAEIMYGDRTAPRRFRTSGSVFASKSGTG